MERLSDNRIKHICKGCYLPEIHIVRHNIANTMEYIKRYYIELGRQQLQDDNCPVCGKQYKYSEKYNSLYCPKCLRWMEPICSDRKCCYCSKRPKYPRMNIK